MILILLFMFLLVHLKHCMFVFSHKSQCYFTLIFTHNVTHIMLHIYLSISHVFFHSHISHICILCVSHLHLTLFSHISYVFIFTSHSFCQNLFAILVLHTLAFHTHLVLTFYFQKRKLHTHLYFIF